MQHDAPSSPAYNYIQGERGEAVRGQADLRRSTRRTPRRSPTSSGGSTRPTTTTRPRRRCSTSASLYDNANDETLLSANYTSVLTSNFFVEGQYSKRATSSMIGTGLAVHRPASEGHADLGPLARAARASTRRPSARSAAPGSRSANNWNAFVKANYFLSTKSLGSHSVVGGFDVYKEMRKNDNYQSGSSFRVQATSADHRRDRRSTRCLQTGTTHLRRATCRSSARDQGQRHPHLLVLRERHWRLNNRLIVQHRRPLRQEHARRTRGARQVVEGLRLEPAPRR